jgi:hypothetical protein
VIADEEKMNPKIVGISVAINNIPDSIKQPESRRAALAPARIEIAKIKT